MRAGAFEGSEFEDASRSMLKRNGPLKRDCFNGPWLDFVSEVALGGPRRPGSLGLALFTLGRSCRSRSSSRR
jgi:hypothetical protein